MTRSHEFARFVGAGAIAALVNWLSRFPLSWIMPFEAAIVAAYLIGMGTAYVLNRQFVFRPTERGVRSELVRFSLVNAVALAQVWVVTVLLARVVFPALNWTWHDEALAHAAGIASPIITSYFGHRYFSFAQKPSQAPSNG